MDRFIQQQLDTIEQSAREITAGIRRIFGYCNGWKTAIQQQSSSPTLQFNNMGNGYQEVISDKPLTEVIKEMIIELKIKGSVRERSNGLIELRTQALGSIYGRTKEELEQKLTQRLKEVKKEAKQKEESAIPTNFDKFAMYWFENFHKRKVKSNTYEESIKLYNRHVRSTFEKYAIKDIKPLMLQKFLDSFADKGKTVDDLHGQLNQIFKAAVNHGLIRLNPLGMCFHKQHERKHGSAISKQDEQLLLATYAGTPYQISFALILYTGLRPNEYTSAVIDNGFIKAKNSKHDKNGKIVYKRIAISPMLKPYLKGIKQIAIQKPHIIEDRFKAVLPNHKLYDMRTTFQTRCSECGIPDNVIGVFMGNSIGKLKEAYTDFSDEYLLAEMKKHNY